MTASILFKLPFQAETKWEKWGNCTCKSAFQLSQILLKNSLESLPNNFLFYWSQLLVKEAQNYSFFLLDIWASQSKLKKVYTGDPNIVLFRLPVVWYCLLQVQWNLVVVNIETEKLYVVNAIFLWGGFIDLRLNIQTQMIVKGLDLVGIKHIGFTFPEAGSPTLRLLVLLFFALFST